MVNLFRSCWGAPKSSHPPVQGEEGVLVTALYKPGEEPRSDPSNLKGFQNSSSDATAVSSGGAGRPSPASVGTDMHRDSSVAYSHDKEVLRQELKRRDMAMILLKKSLHEETQLRERSQDQQRGFGAFLIARAAGLEAMVSRSGERAAGLERELQRREAEAELKDRELEELRGSTGPTEGALLDSCRISHLESRLMHLEEENLKLRDRLMQRGAEMQGLAEIVEEAGGFVGDNCTQGKTQKQQQQQPKVEKRTVKKRAASAGQVQKQPSRASETQMNPADKARRATAAVKAASLAAKKRPSQKKSTLAATAVAAPSVRASANGPLPKSSSKAKKAAPKSRAAAASENLFRIEACCEQCRASQGGCGWPAAVLSELRRCTGDDDQASAFLSALAGAAGCKSGADNELEAQRMLETYTWGLKTSGDPAAGAFDVYQALPRIVASCRFPAGLRSSAPAASSAFQGATPSSVCSEAAAAPSGSSPQWQWQAPTPSPMHPAAGTHHHHG